MPSILCEEWEARLGYIAAMPWLLVVVVVYALLMLGGGVAGYVTAQSVPSLITGIISGMTLLGAAALAKTNPSAGYGVAAGATTMLIAIFISRFVETHKPMPSLGLVGISVLVLILLGVGHLMNKS